ncbi:MAG: hypothetical protein GY832_04965 [Chloroflexi bacterium]|nr:hypothetical protein [Chloroflexota bacterium]
MVKPSLLFADSPDLTDEAVSGMLDFLYEVTAAFENRYYAQLMRHDQQCEAVWLDLQAQHEEKQQDLFAEFDDNLPDF